VVVPVVIALMFILPYLTFRSVNEALLVVGNVPFALV
jgi:heavy metal efflux system protein